MTVSGTQTTVDEQTIIHRLQADADFLNRIADRIAQGADPTEPMWPDTETTSTILHHANIYATGDTVGRLVMLCRQRGLSWSEVGEALGISKQAAWERFRAYVD